METITNIAQSAVKAVWGSSPEQKEPVSGAQGDVAKGEPFDAGNKESNAADASTTVDTKPAAEPAPAVSQSPLSSNKKDVKDVKDTKEVKDAKGIQDVKEVKDAKAIKDVKDNAVTRQQVKGGSPVNAPVPAKSQPQPPLDSTTKDKSDKSKSKGGPVVGEDGEKQLAGKGPKPLATVAKENGGDAGNVHTESKAKAKANTSESSKKSNEKDAQEKGTGEKLVKTSGLAADGGNFDATKPGAGKEADRLMEEKGVQRETSGSPKSHKPDSVSSGGKSHEKPSIKERVKDKLHLNKD
ncbi:hypothetical protein E4U54_005909 [Claviceps lovelessii]|nr:hypothetical protein E4U54_005909 [Claviceps lovelessii]